LSAGEQLAKGINETVTGSAIAILQKAHYELDMLDDGTAVITKVGDMVQAYNLLYRTMDQTGTATIAELNNAYA